MPRVTPRLPGLRFVTVSPPVAPGLPRMDVAAFVGLASTGPVGIPISVEDEVRFREIFGPDLPLAWDAERGETTHAHLGPAVREFFRNGGRRCWVVRVGDEATMETAVFRVPGVLHGCRDRTDAAYLLASSPGSWADRVSVNATLLVRSVSPDMVAPEADGVRLDVESRELLRLEWSDGTLAFFPPRPTPPEHDLTAAERRKERVRRFADAYWFRSLDVAELGGPGHAPSFLLGPREVGLATEAWTIQGEADERRLEIRLAAGDAAGLHPGCWIRTGFDPASPPHDDAAPDEHALLLVDEVARGDDVARIRVRHAWRALDHRLPWFDTLGRASAAALLSLELWTRTAGGAVVRLADVGLVPGHPRFLGDFPPDQVLFAPAERLTRSVSDPLHQDLREALSTRRWQLAAPDRGSYTVAADGAVHLRSHGPVQEGERLLVRCGGGDGTEHQRLEAYLPLGAHAVLRDEAYQSAHTSGRDPLERNGAGRFSADLFLDPDLAGASAETLLDTAFHNSYVAEPPRPPVRMHALLRVNEVSLLAVPDAVHAGWRLRTTEPATPAATLDAPSIRLPIDEPDADGRITVWWTRVDDARGYVLEDSPDPRFRTGVRRTAAAIKDDVPITHATVIRPRPCPDRLYFRVRADSATSRSPWSPTALLASPDDAFAMCEAAPLEAPVLVAISASGEQLELTWRAGAEPAALAHARAGLERVYLVQSSPEPGFGLPEVVYQGTDTRARMWKPLSGVLHFRAAARLQEPDDPQGAGSPPIVEDSPWSATQTYRVQPTERWETLSPHDAASPPGEAGGEVTLRVHRAMLRFCAARSDCFAVLALPRHHREDDALGHVAALTTGPGADAAARALSFGAIYHPWTVVRTPAPGAPLRAVPPDGATCGVMAFRANDPGAWAAPANQPLAGVAILDPKLPEVVLATWLGQRVNAIVTSPRGFVTWSEETLSADPELRGVGVRRLLILLRRLALREGNTYVFEPNDQTFRRLVQRQFDAVLADLFARGAFAGADHTEAYRVVTDDSVNPSRSVDQGRLVAELRVAPSSPLAFLTVRLVQTSAGVTVREG
jgi:hypothetical protein